jgi:RimJ/RimL family protein N-acetyltransferase
MPELFTLEGRQVRLEPMFLEHVDDLLAAATEERSTFALTPIPSDRAAMVTYVEKALAARLQGTQVPFVTRSLDTDRVVGSTRFYDIEYWDWSTSVPSPEADRQGPGPDSAHIGYTWLAPSAQRTSINTEAKLAMLAHAFDTWRARVVRLQTDARNQRSRRAIERLGCRLDGVIRSDRPGADGAVRDTATFSMLAAEWPQAKLELRSRLRTSPR